MSFNRYLMPALLRLICVNGLLAADVAPIDLVDDTAALCVEIRYPEAAFSKFQTSHLATRLKAFPPARRFLDGAGFQKWALVEDYVRRTTGKSLSDQILAACSESLVLAVYLPDGKPPEGVVIAKANDAAALTQALQAWATLEPKQVSKAKEYQGQAYVQRARSARPGDSIFYVVFDRTIALSDHEHRIQQVIEFRIAGDRQSSVAQATGSLTELPLYKANRSRLPQDAVAFLFLNTRKWDRVIDDGLRNSRDAAWIRQIVSRVAALSAALRLNDEVVMDLAADTEGSELPEIWRQFVHSTDRGDNDWAKRISTDSILAISSRMDVTPLVQHWLASASEAKTEDFGRGRNVLKSILQGRDPVTEIVPRVLRDWTIALVPASEVSTGVSPVDLIGEFSLGDDTALSRNLDQAIQFGMTLLSATVSHQRGPSAKLVLVESRSTNGGIERWISGLENWSPACLASPERLILASCHQAIVARSASAAPDSAKASRLAVHENRYFRGTSQLLWIDSVRLRELLAQHGDWITNQLTEETTNDRERVQQHLFRIEEIAKLFDAAFVAAQFDEQRVRVVFGAALDRTE